MEISTWLYILVALVCGFIGVAYIYLNHVFQYWKKKGVKYIKPTFPFGTGKGFMLMQKPIGDVYEDNYKELKGEKFGGVYILQTPQLLLRDPEVIKSFLVKDFEHFHDRGFAADESFDPLSGNLFQLNGGKWKDMRNKLSPTFTSGKMKIMFEAVTYCANELKVHLQNSAKNGEKLDVKEIMAKYTTDVIASCVFGIKSNCLKDPDAEFRYWGKKALDLNWEGTFRQMIYIVMPSVALNLKIKSVKAGVEKFFFKIVSETVKFREKNNVTKKDFMQLLLQIKNQVSSDDVTNLQNRKEGLTLEEITAQAFVFLLAGFETSSSTLSFCLYELALKPQIQERLRNEINAVLQKHDGLITYDAIQEMDYLDKVIAETLRLHPTLPFLNRECTKKYKIPGTNVTLDEGTQVVIPVQALHFDPQYFPKPENFDPERFNDEIKNKRHHYTYMPFGEGPRICIGMRFAQMQIKLGLASLLPKYEFHVCDKTPIPLKKNPKQFFNIPSVIHLKIKEHNS